MATSIGQNRHHPNAIRCVHISMVVFTRKEAVADALQSLEIESLDPGQKARKLADTYARGRISHEDLCVAFDQLNEQERLEH